MTEERLNVFPSRMVLTGLKDRTSAARTGHSLLKRKSDAIKANLNMILKEILEIKRRLFKTVMRDAYFSHTEAVYYAGDFNNQVIENTKTAQYKVRASVKNVAGVRIPIFSKLEDELTQQDTMVGLSSGGRQVVKCKETFSRALMDLVKLASLQTSLKTLDDALKVTNRRVNALEFVILPLLDNTMKYVIAELDELEREDQYRIKKVKDLRTREAEAEDEAAKKEADRRRRLGLPVAGQTTSEPSQNIIDMVAGDTGGASDNVADAF